MKVAASNVLVIRSTVRTATSICKYRYGCGSRDEDAETLKVGCRDRCCVAATVNRYNVHTVCGEDIVKDEYHMANIWL